MTAARRLLLVVAAWRLQGNSEPDDMYSKACNPLWDNQMASWYQVSFQNCRAGLAAGLAWVWRVA
jgi:hypothetical protein